LLRAEVERLLRPDSREDGGDDPITPRLLEPEGFWRQNAGALGQLVPQRRAAA
jgi:hypothetical protein